MIMSVSIQRMKSLKSLLSSTPSRGHRRRSSSISSTSSSISTSSSLHYHRSKPSISITDLSITSSPRSSLDLASSPTAAAALDTPLNLLLHAHLPALEEHYVTLMALSSYPLPLRRSPDYLQQKKDATGAVARLISEMEKCVLEVELVELQDDGKEEIERRVGEVAERMWGAVGLCKSIGGL